MKRKPRRKERKRAEETPLAVMWRWLPRPRLGRQAWVGIGAASASTLALLAALPYQLGDVALLIPPEWKARLTVVGGVSALVLRVINSSTMTDK